ncbi:hypothetical protein SESBI_47910 [Sesbania bispinosa]|nr:hypothetical protein SESBI_47910 [Sesbania bispinosa]
MTSQSNSSSHQNKQPPPHEDPPLIVYDGDDVHEGVDACVRSLVGRIITDKPIHTNSMQNALSGMWCNPKGMKIEEVAPKTFQIFFEKEEDANRILLGSPWIFRNSWLVLRQWERTQSFENMDFSKIPIKLQLWGLPAHCKTPKMGMKIGACMGIVRNAELYETRDKGTFIKVLVEIDVHNSLKKGDQCKDCGVIGHDEESCTQKNENGNVEDEESNFGPWLRASQVGRLVRSNLSGSSHPGSERMRPTKKTQISADVMAMLSSLSVTKEA